MFAEDLVQLPPVGIIRRHMPSNQHNVRAALSILNHVFEPILLHHVRHRLHMNLFGAVGKVEKRAKRQYTSTLVVGGEAAVLGCKGDGGAVGQGDVHVAGEIAVRELRYEALVEVKSDGIVCPQDVSEGGNRLS